jgi:hypothetical protein
MLRTKIIAGLTAMLALGAVAGPAVAQTTNESGIRSRAPSPSTAAATRC